MKVAVIEVSPNRKKFGNKTARAYITQTDKIYTVNPNYAEIEGIHAYNSVLENPNNLDRITVYLPPKTTLTLLIDLAQKVAKEIPLNPGSENKAVIIKGEELGLNLFRICRISDNRFKPR